MTEQVENLNIQEDVLSLRIENEALREVIIDLEAQIEKMKCCGNCKHQCSFLFQDEIDCANNGLPKWEIKENE